MNTLRPLDAIEEWANQYNKDLLCNDKRFLGCSLVVHRDGSTTFRSDSFLVDVSIDKFKFIVQFSEHHPPCWWDRDDLLTIKQYQKRGFIEKIKVPLPLNE